MDVFRYLRLNSGKFDTIILDPPYNTRFAKKYNKVNQMEADQFVIFSNSKKTTILFDHIRRLKLKRIIIKSWNYYVPKDYELSKGYLCYAGGYRRQTILEVLDRC